MHSPSSVLVREVAPRLSTVFQMYPLAMSQTANASSSVVVPPFVIPAPTDDQSMHPVGNADSSATAVLRSVSFQH